MPSKPAELVISHKYKGYHKWRAYSGSKKHRYGN